MLLFFLSCFVTAQNPTAQNPTTSRDFISPDEVDRKGELSPPSKYQSFSNGGLRGLQDRNGIEVLGPTFESIQNVERPYWGNYPELFVAQLGGRFFLYKVGVGRITTESYESIEYINSGTMIAYDATNYFLLNEEGYRICNEQFELIYDLSYRNHEDFLVVCNEACALANREGELLSEQVFDSISDLDTRVFLIAKDNLFGLMDGNGEVMLEPSFDGIRLYAKDTYLANYNGFELMINGNGEMFFFSNFVSLNDANEELLIAEAENGRLGIINLEGKVIIEPEYSTLEPFVLKSSIVSIDGKFGVISMEGEVIVDLLYDTAKRVKGGFKARNGNKWVRFDKKGNCIRDCDYLR